MSGRRIAIIVVLILALCCVFGALGVLVYRLLVPTVVAEEAGPTILIDSPRQGDEVIVGETVQIFATGRDPRKIDHMELWVDGALIESQASALPGGTSPFPLAGEWVPGTTGNHTIVVRGYNTADVSGQASVSVNAVEGPAIPTEMPPEGCEGVPLLVHEVQEGETLEDIAAAYGVTVEEILACNPGLDPTAALTPGEELNIPNIVSPDEEGPPAEGEEPGDVDVPPEVPPEAEEPPGEELPPEGEEPPPGEEAPPEAEEPPEPPEGVEPPEPPEPTAVLEFEAYELEADQPYDGVYCMVSLADADTEMVPDMDSFDPVIGNYWDIEAELGGANSRMVIVYEDTLNLRVECFGFTGALLPVSLGTVERAHPEADWTGDPIEVTSIDGEGGRWFRAVYRICPFPCEPRPIPDAPQNLTHVEFPIPTLCGCIIPPWICIPCPPPLHFMSWDWLGDETTIDGFRLYRNDALLYEVANPSARWMQITEADANPDCGETYNYHLVAYEGLLGVGPESDPSNIVTFEGEPCPRTVTVTFEELNTGCLLADCPPGFDECSDCDPDYWYGRVSANAERIRMERPSFWDIITGFSQPHLHSFTGYTVNGLFGEDTLTLELGPDEDLTIGILLKDRDLFGSDDTLCDAALAIDSADVVDSEDLVLECYGDPIWWFHRGHANLIFSLDVSP